MKEIIEFLTDNSTIFVATSDKGEARVRPFQFQFEQGGRLWFCTSRQKEVFAQLQADPRMEFAATSKNMVTLRVKGEVVLDDDMTVKERVIAGNGLVRSLYGTADNPDFTVFGMEHGTAFMFDFSGQPPKSFTF
jgi:uncharacterized pyridoxamine 5'-phosphate oxidase family protein